MSETPSLQFLGGTGTGEILANTWNKELKTRRSIEKEPITVGSGDNSVELAPHPMDADPLGSCSRFYGEANWVRGGGVHHGWIQGGESGHHKEFEWQRCWRAGRTHGHMCEEMGDHQHMGLGHGPSHHGGRTNR